MAICAVVHLFLCNCVLCICFVLLTRGVCRGVGRRGSTLTMFACCELYVQPSDLERTDEVEYKGVWKETIGRAVHGGGWGPLNLEASCSNTVATTSALPASPSIFT